MTFLNISLLLGLVAVAIPIALHLIARKEPKQVLFPSVRLLTQRFETNRSKVQVRRWWLLALRIAALAAVALALARPTIAGALSLTWSTIGIIAAMGVGLLALASVAASKPNQRTLMWSLLAASALAIVSALAWGGLTLASGQKPSIDQATPIALAIVVDNAPVAAWQTVDDDHMAHAREVATQLIASASQESRFAVLDRSSTPATFALDVSGATSKANQIQAIELAQPLESRVEAAARLLATSDITSRQLVLISGLAESSFDAKESARSLAALTEELGVSVTIFDLGDFKGINRTLSLPVLSDDSPAPGNPVTITATVTLDGDASGKLDDPIATTAECVLFPASPSLPVVRDGQIVRPDAKPVDRFSVNLEPGRSAEMLMTLPPLPVGLHHGAIRLIGSDALAVDDTSYFTVAVLPPSRILLVGDQTDRTRVIARTISAPLEPDDPAAQYAIERIGFDDLAAARIEDFDGVILLDPTAAALEEPELLRYLSLGGSVMISAGRQFGTERVSANGFPTLQRPWRSTKPGTFLEITASSHPALEDLANLPGGVPFSDFRIEQYWQIPESDPSQVLMRYAGTGHPALVERKWNDDSRGRVLVLTTPIPELADTTDSWNELFSAQEYWPSLMLVRGLTRYLTRRNTSRWTSIVGSPVSFDWEPNEKGGNRRLQWFPPVGSTAIPIDVAETESPESSQRIVLGSPSHSGVHWIRGERLGLGFTVNAGREDLSTRRLASQRMESLFGKDRFRLIESIEEMDWTAGDAAQSVPLWSPMMLIALVVFLLEQILSNRFYRKTSSPKTAPALARSAV